MPVSSPAGFFIARQPGAQRLKKGVDELILLSRSKRRETFCQAIAAGQSNRQAAISSGYSERSATSIGSQLVSTPIVAARIRQLRDEQLSAVKLLNELREKLTAATV